MYKIETHEEHLMVRFEDDFDYLWIQTIIHHVTMMRQYPSMNDIWHIGSHRAEIHLGDIETMVREFQCLCPRDATRTKTAVVVDEGLTGAIIELWVNGLKKRVAFEIQIFRTLEEARAWLGVMNRQVA